MGYLMGIDLGTSSVKTVIIDESGNIRGSAQSGYPILIPRMGQAEQQPETWWASAACTIRASLREAGVSPRDVEAVGLSGQMHGTVLLDDQRNVIRPAIIWSDQRTVQEVRRVYRVLGRKALGEIARSPACTGFQTLSLLWIRKHEPENYRRIDKVLLPKDYLRMKLTDAIGTDVTDASATLAFDTARREWSQELIQRLGLNPSFYPPVSNPFEIAGYVTAEASRETGLAPGTPVVFGGGDQPMQAVGNGIVFPGQVSLTIGTGGQVFSVVERPDYDPLLRTHTFCNAVPNTWNILGAMLSAGLSLSWLNDKVLSGLSYEDVNALSGSVGAGSEGLIFLPYLSGERTPHMDPAARGAFLGLTLKHGKSHLIRAVMEGVVFALRDSVEIFQSLGIPMDTFIASGGGARSPVWMQIQADVLNREIYKTDQTEQACVGAAIMAGVGVKRYKSVSEACLSVVRLDDRPVSPIPGNVRIYEEVYGMYRDAYRRNRTLFRGLGGIESLPEGE